MAGKRQKKRATKEVWERVRALNILLDAKGKPRYGPTEITRIVNREHGLDLLRPSVSRKISVMKWDKERERAVASAFRQLHFEDGVEKPGPDNPAGKMDMDEEDILNRTKLAVISHMEKYLKGTEKVTTAALSALEFELFMHHKAAGIINQKLKAGADVDDPEIVRYRKHMINQQTLVMIARLGQLMTSGQITVALTHVQKVENKTLIIQWGGDKYPDPPEPDEARMIEQPEALDDGVPVTEDEVDELSDYEEVVGKKANIAGTSLDQDGDQEVDGK